MKPVATEVKASAAVKPSAVVRVRKREEREEEERRGREKRKRVGCGD